ncbi:MAG: hypothetical protein ACWA40_11110 [Planktomarina sp.]
MRFAYVTALALMGCNTPTPEFYGAAKQRVIVGQSTFDVRRSGDRAQAIRINTEWAPNWRHTYARFAIAIEGATGCTIKPKSMQGDQALMEARLDCPYATRPNPPDETIVLECYEGSSTYPGFDCEVRQSVATPYGP